VQLLEEKLLERNQDLNGFGAQLRELQIFLHSKLDRQNHSGLLNARFFPTKK